VSGRGLGCALIFLACCIYLCDQRLWLTQLYYYGNHADCFATRKAISPKTDARKKHDNAADLADPAAWKKDVLALEALQFAARSRFEEQINEQPHNQAVRHVRQLLTLNGSKSLDGATVWAGDASVASLDVLKDRDSDLDGGRTLGVTAANRATVIRDLGTIFGLALQVDRIAAFRTKDAFGDGRYRLPADSAFQAEALSQNCPFLGFREWTIKG
jgi:hypothetical protein